MDKDTVIKEFSSNIRAERARKNYSQEYLAEMADISTEYLNKIEREKYNPSITVAVNLAIALGINLETLLPVSKLIMSNTTRDIH